MPRSELSIKITLGKPYWHPDVFISMKPNLQLLGNVNTVNPTYSTLKKKRCRRNLAYKLADD